MPTTPQPLTPELAELLERGQRALRGGDPRAAMRDLRDALAAAPDHPDVLRCAGMAAQGLGEHAQAAAFARRALHATPDDANLHRLLGVELGRMDDAPGATASLQRACELAPDSWSAWYNFGEALQAAGEEQKAIEAIQHALDIDPTHPDAQLSLARAQINIGQIDAAADRLRDTLRQDPANADAWWLLADLKTIAFSAADTQQLQAALAHADLPHRSRILLGFALAHALEDQGDYARAFDTLSEANRLQRYDVPWNAAAEHKRVDAIVEVFSQPVAMAPHATLGREAIFIASLPRSGSTLIEQILASHPQVEGANEITVLGELITGEAKRHRLPFPMWIPATNAAHFESLGTQYLARTVSSRNGKPRFTDKNLLNWMFVGTALAMLPAAKVVIVRRDPVETCLACYRQWFASGSQFSCELDDMADRCIDFWRLRHLWIQTYPRQILDLEYETLLAEPEASIRRLLEFCELPFDRACFQFYRTSRSVLSSPSAAQVRQPLRRDTTRAHRYGARLEPLRERLRKAGLPNIT